jgi:hypothetical protein
MAQSSRKQKEFLYYMIMQQNKKYSCFICFALKLINRNTRLLVLKGIGLDDGGKSSTWSRNYK